MSYKIHAPAPVLARFVEFFWFFDDLAVSHAMERVLPQGSFELVIDLRETPRKLFTNDAQTSWRNFRRAWISGAHAKFKVIDVLPGACMIGVHFRPGGAAPFLDLPCEELMERVEEIDAIWGSAGLELRQKLLETPSVQQKFGLLEEFLLARLCRANAHFGALDFALGRLLEEPSTTVIAELASELGISHKHFIAQFRARVGLTPKVFCRIRRFQQALSEIERRNALDWVSLAADAGYFDQAHFIKDFGAFSGLNPSRYMTERGEHMNFVPLGSR